MQALKNSPDCLLAISEFLTPKFLLDFQLMSKKYYDKIVPQIMMKRNMYPSLQTEIHFFLDKKVLYGLKLTNATETREIDFEEDPWRQDYQNIIVGASDPKQANSIDHKAVVLFDFEKHLEEGEIILPHYIVRLNTYKILVFPLLESKKITRTLLVEFNPLQPATVEKFAGPPMELFRPGVCHQLHDGKGLNEVMFLGGNDKLLCHKFSLDT